MTTTQTKFGMLVQTKTFRAHMWQRFRYNPSGREYVLTQTKRGKTTVWVPMPHKATGPGVVAEQWRKAEAAEAAEAINDIAAWHGKLAEFLQFFAKN